ncbi:uncharacterized protein, cytoplasmic domain of flagellar protein FhlB like protein [Methylophilaceae bacterium 11]|nr:uncharacterized protein, cytoplasmic domain of flagellar protein FhlB like protein [Methylophilaceae bacterium 11]
MSKLKQNLGLAVGKGTQLPAVVFKGYGAYADFYEKEFKRIKPQSRIVKDKELLEKLAKLPVNSDISPDLYQLVAILLVYVYSLEKIKKD